MVGNPISKEAEEQIAKGSLIKLAWFMHLMNNLVIISVGMEARRHLPSGLSLLQCANVPEGSQFSAQVELERGIGMGIVCLLSRCKQTESCSRFSDELDWVCC